ncbi:hypothetical protein [Natronorubrum sp. DTA7]|uniref:hypothetical protein n=1 Tax=Natronorubrum sp. DTA7 TaxID=3447016 RepID=UPI003F83DD65
MERPLGLSSFAAQSRGQHALTVVGGLALCLAVYFGTVAAVFGNLDALATEASITEQRVGGAVASVAVWTYFGLAFVRGYGGPVLNLVYPIAIVVAAPFVARWVLFGPDVSGLVSRFVGLVLVEPLATTLLVVVPGVAAFLAVLTVWSTSIAEERRREWERQHLPAEFYDAFVAEAYE